MAAICQPTAAQITSPRGLMLSMWAAICDHMKHYRGLKNYVSVKISVDSEFLPVSASLGLTKMPIDQELWRMRSSVIYKLSL
jgi:hypothetical protein